MIIKSHRLIMIILNYVYYLLQLILNIFKGIVKMSFRSKKFVETIQNQSI